MSFQYTIKKCLVTVDGKKYTKNEIKIGDNLMFIHYGRPDYRGKIMIDLKKSSGEKSLEPEPAPAKQVKVKEYSGDDNILKFTWKGPWQDEDTGLETTKTLDFKIDFERSIDGMRVYLLLIGKPLDGKWKLKNIKKSKTKRRKVRTIKDKKSKKKGRKGPEESATEFPVGEEKQGNDGNMWVIQASKNGIQRWVKYKKQKGGHHPKIKNVWLAVKGEGPL